MAPSESSSRTAGDRSEPLAYLFGLAPGVVVLVVGPWLAALGPATLTVAVSLAVRAAGVVLLVAGLAVAAWAVHSFARAGEPPSPVGTPERLVTDGALAYSRNPIYLGTVAGVAGEAVAFGSLAGSRLHRSAIRDAPCSRLASLAVRT